MDLLSISGSVAGLLTASAGLAKVLANFVDAYDIAKVIHQELLEFRVVLQQLQPLALGKSFLDVARASMIDIAHVEVTLVGAVLTFSELEREIDRLQGSVAFSSVRTRLKWTWAQSSLNGLIQRLQNHKGSLSLMLLIMTSETHVEALDKMTQLQNTIFQLMDTLQDTRRMQQHAAPLLIGRVGIAGSIRTVRSVQSSFEAVLLRTRVYNISQLWQFTPNSSIMEGKRIGSVLSQKSLSEISNIAVYELPICADEVENGYWYSLIPAVRAGDLQLVSSLLYETRLSGKSQALGEEAMSIAAEGDDEDMILTLVSRGATAKTTLHRAAELGWTTLVEMLLENGADVNAVDPAGKTPLRLAVENNQTRIAKFLVASGAQVNTGLGGKPIHYAVQNGNAELVKLLLEHGADKDATDPLLRSPLNIAAAYGNIALVKLLLEFHADVNMILKARESPLHTAAENGSTEVAKLLLESGAEIDARDFFDRVPIHQAVRYGHTEVVELLLIHGAQVNNQNYDHETPLHTAAQYGRTEVARLLLEYGARVAERDDHRKTPLHTAALYGSTEVARLLLEGGAEINASDSDNKVPVYHASQYGRTEVIELLCKYGAQTKKPHS